MERWLHGQMKRLIDGQIDRWIDGYGQMERWIDGKIDRWNNEQMNRYIKQKTYTVNILNA